MMKKPDSNERVPWFLMPIYLIGGTIIMFIIMVFDLFDYLPYIFTVFMVIFVLISKKYFLKTPDKEE